MIHPTQIATALGLTVEPTLESSRLAWDLIPIMEAWQAHLKLIDWNLMNKPTPSRGRTLRSLTVNVHHPIKLLCAAWLTGHYSWIPSATDAAIEESLHEEDDVRTYASTAYATCMAFLTEHGDRLQETNPTISTPKGEVAFADLISTVRFHSAYHYRQLVEFLSSEGIVLANAFSVELLRDLDLPAAAF